MSFNSNIIASANRSDLITKVCFKNTNGTKLNLQMLSSVLGIKTGDNYSEEQIKQAVIHFSSLLSYTVLKWNRNDGLLNVYVEKKHRIKSISFSGNKNLSKKLLLENIGFEPVGAYCEDLCQTIEDRIIKFYKNNGFYKINIDKQIVPLPKANEVKILYLIQENNQAVFKNIDIQAQGSVDSTTVKKILNINVGENAGYFKVHDAVKKLRSYLYRRGYYSQSVSKNLLSFDQEMTEATFTFVINTGPKYKIIIRGNNTFTDVKDLIDALDILESDKLNSEFYKVLVSKLKKYYAKVGMDDVKIEIHEELGEKSGELLLVFNIEEPVRKYLRRILFITKDLDLSDEISDYVEDNNKEFFQSGLFIKENFEKIKVDIKNYLEKKGYLKSRIKDIKYIEKKNNTYEVVYELEEGDRTKIRSFNISGNTIFDKETIAVIFNIKEGEPLDLGNFNLSMRELASKYKIQGYIDYSFDKDSLTNYSKDYRFVDIDLKINEGNRYKVGEIFVEGLNITKLKVVTRELLFEQEQWLDMGLMQSTETNLVALGIFKLVSVNVLPISRKEQGNLYRDILIKLEEKKVGEYEIGIGYRTDDGIRLFTGIAYNNLGGWNRRISGDAIVSRKLDNEFKFMEYDFTVSYYEPYLLDIPFNFRTSAEFMKEDLPSFDRKKFDLSFYFEKFFGKHSLILRNAFERINVFDAVLDVEDAIYWKYSIRQMYQYDSRDSIFNPNKGLKFYVYVEWGHSIQGDVAANYIKVADKSKVYIPFWENWMFAPALGSGYIRGLSGSSLLLDDRFALGGSGNLRGFRESIINDVSPELDSQYYYTFSLELRRKLIWNLVGLVFYDIGDLYTLDQGFNGPFSSVGGGLSLTFAVGALSFEYGYIYDKNSRIPADRVGRLHLSIQ